LKQEFSKDERDSILQILMNKYQVDRDSFRSYLPGIAHQFEKHVTSDKQTGHRSVVAQLEREKLCNSLLTFLGNKNLTKDEAIEALEYCATLIQDGSLPYEIDRRSLLGLIQKVVGTPVSKVTRTTKTQVGDGEARKEVAVLRDVHFDLTWNDRLVTVSIFPEKAKERTQALKLFALL